VNGAAGATAVVWTAGANTGAERAGVVVITIPGAKTESSTVEFTVVQAGSAPPVNSIGALLAEVTQQIATAIKQIISALASFG
ncbi:MAG: hypothetical protein LBH76_05805, partial [Propionibacteriaceae bacterium]|nr:hypothetical protein [Propionibacteriaceae bacterium]